MPFQWSRDLRNLTPDASATPLTRRFQTFTIDQASIFAFREETFGNPTPGTPAVAVAAAPAGAWSAARPSPQARRPRPLPQLPTARKIGFTGVVDLVQGRIHLCPLVEARGMARYRGLDRYGQTNMVPIDHYAGQAMQTAFGAAVAANIAAGTAADSRVRIALGRPGALAGTHRIPGTRANSQDDRARTFDAGMNDPNFLHRNYWDSAGHQQLVQRLRLVKDNCAGFAIVKNGIGPSHHELLFVSRLNTPHFGARGVSTQMSLAILHSFMQSIP